MALIGSEKRRQEAALFDERRRIGAEPSRRRLDDELVQNVVAGRIDDVEQDDQDRDPEQIPVLPHKLESAFRAERFDVGGRGLRLGSSGLTRVHDERRQERQHQYARTKEHQRVGCVAEASNERGDRGGPQQRAKRLADADEGKQPAPLSFRVQVVRKGPELRHDEHVDESDPDIEGDAFTQSNPPPDIEADERERRRTSSRSRSGGCAGRGCRAIRTTARRP